MSAPEPTADITLTQCTLGDHWARGRVRLIALRTYDVEREAWDETRVACCPMCYSKLRTKTTRDVKD